MISRSFVASDSGYFEKDDAGGKRDSELTLMRVSDIAEVEVKSIDGREFRDAYTSVGRPQVKFRDNSSVDVTLGSRQLARKPVSELISNLVRMVGASS